MVQYVAHHESKNVLWPKHSLRKWIKRTKTRGMCSSVTAVIDSFATAASVVQWHWRWLSCSPSCPLWLWFTVYLSSHSAEQGSRDRIALRFIKRPPPPPLQCAQWDSTVSRGLHYYNFVKWQHSNWDQTLKRRRSNGFASQQQQLLTAVFMCPLLECPL